MKNPSLIQLLYLVPKDQKQWPDAAEWAYAIAFVLVFFVAVPWIWGA